MMARDNGTNGGAARRQEDGFSSRTIRGLWFTFGGRLNRMRYFMRVLPVYLLAGAVSSVVEQFFWIGLLYFPILWATLSLISRRSHDMGYRPWLLMILSFIPILGLATTVYLLIMKGDSGPNRFGPDPLEQPFDIR